MRSRLVRSGLVTALTGLCMAVPGSAQNLTESDSALVRAVLWPESDEALAEAQVQLMAAPWATGATKAVMEVVTEIAAEGPVRRGLPPTLGDNLNELLVPTAGGRAVPMLVRLPSGWSPDRQWPLLLAMHGGPTGNAQGALMGAVNMIAVWADAAEEAGWIVAAPAMVDVVARAGRTEDRLPYEIFHAEEARAVVDTVRARYRVDADRVVSTGISLGSNFSIAYAASHPDWLAATVPVSTEGESRVRLLRNLATVPMYVLNGALDRNIRGVSGPRALRDRLTELDADLTYREFTDRAHEGFQEHYPDVLDWLEQRPRSRDPRRVVRVPHTGISPTARQVHWVESFDRQGVVSAAVDGNTIHATARWTRGVRLHLNDRLVDLDRPVRVVVNGHVVFEEQVERSVFTALRTARVRRDEKRLYPVVLSVDVPAPASPESWAALDELTGLVDSPPPSGTLSFWETYAVRSLEERSPSLGIEGVEVDLPSAAGSAVPEQVAVLVEAVEPTGLLADIGIRPGDVLVDVNREPFYRDRGGLEALHAWLIRELRSHEQRYRITVVREGSLLRFSVGLALGPYTG